MFVTRCAFAAVQFSEDWADARVDKESRRPKIEQGDSILSFAGCYQSGNISEECRICIARIVSRMHCTESGPRMASDPYASIGPASPGSN
jgi:hypothetical protein